MFYSIGDMANRLHVLPSTLRYYDKEGLLPFVERSQGGIRRFKESDYEWLKVIECMKKAGMSIKDIKTYIHLAIQGDSTIEERGKLFEKQRMVFEKKMEEMEKTMKVLQYKCWFYKMAKDLGSIEKVNALKEEEIPSEYVKVRRELSFGFKED